jgi:NAD-dependent SIR2 family protein deacetylase
VLCLAHSRNNMRIINMLGQEVEVKCRSCGNENPAKLYSRHEDNQEWHWCDMCGSSNEAEVLARDGMEELYMKEFRYQPKLKEHMLAQHRKEQLKIKNTKSMPHDINRIKNYESRH